MTLTTIGYAFIGGLLPSLVWLYFLLKEDAKHPEPRSLIALTFIAGMAAVPLVLPLEHYAKVHLTGTFPVLTAWALAEELLKYLMAAFLILWRGSVDEAPDYVIYMITIALGFASAENMLFLMTPLSDGNVMGTFLTGDVRFLGSTLLHVVASAAIGFALAFSARDGGGGRIIAGGVGLILAVTLHTAFNLLIMNQGAAKALVAFFFVWIVAVIFFAAFEVLKYFQYRNQ